MIEEAISNNGNKTYLHILSQYRLLVSRYVTVSLVINLETFSLFKVVKLMDLIV